MSENAGLVPRNIAMLDDGLPLSVATVAKLCGVKRQTVYKWIKNGWLKKYPVGKGIKIFASDLKEFFKTSHLLPPRAKKAGKVAASATVVTSEAINKVIFPKGLN